MLSPAEQRDKSPSDARPVRGYVAGVYVGADALHISRLGMKVRFAWQCLCARAPQAALSETRSN